MNYYALLPLASVFGNVFLWTFVYALHNRSRTKRIYLWFIVHCALWGLSDFLAWNHTDPSFQYVVLRLGTAAWIPITPLYMYFAYLLTRRPVDWLLYFFAAGAFVFLGLGTCTDMIVKDIRQTHWGVLAIPGALYYESIIFCTMLPGLFSIWFIGRQAFRSTGIERKQLFFFLSGIVFTWALVLLVNVFTLLWFETFEVPKLGSTFALLQAIIVFIASTRYRFLNVGVQEVAMDIFSKASDGVVLLDCNGQIIEINDAAQKMLGLSPKQTLSSHIDQLVPAPYQFNRNCDNLEIEFSQRQAEDMRLGLLSQCDFYQGSIWAGKLLTIKNITSRKAAEQAERVQAILREKVRRNQEMKMLALGELAGEIVHNVNNLMSGIIGYTSLLRRKLQSNQEVQPLLDGIQNTVENASKMGKELLLFTQTSESPSETVDIHESIRNSIRLAEHSFNEGIHFEMMLNASQSHILASPADLENVILNMCINAKDAMPTGGRIFIATENDIPAPQLSTGDPHAATNTEKTALRLTVRDTGAGIDSAIIDRVFEPFFTTKKSRGGTGLGLSNTFGIIQRLGGTISAENLKEGGAAFTIVLPVHKKVSRRQSTPHSL
ncbi:MAG: PAS domain-containing protein [Deltaproteobacteria bacterium]|nr:PAS domain-containing protein [Deltaproteobacteria bacterium]MBN2672843.1 PAS domain-containing protein [Deltaproteobacteria bacterium]